MFFCTCKVGESTETKRRDGKGSFCLGPLFHRSISRNRSLSRSLRPSRRHARPGQQEHHGAAAKTLQTMWLQRRPSQRRCGKKKKCQSLGSTSSPSRPGMGMKPCSPRPFFFVVWLCLTAIYWIIDHLLDFLSSICCQTCWLHHVLNASLGIGPLGLRSWTGWAIHGTLRCGRCVGDLVGDLSVVTVVFLSCKMSETKSGHMIHEPFAPSDPSYRPMCFLTFVDPPGRPIARLGQIGADTWLVMSTNNMGV